MTSNASLPSRIRAHVADSAIDRVTRFFNATPSDTFAELLQNARRGGADTVSVTAHPHPYGGHLVTCTDNGRGIEDPAVLLAFGQSGWDSETAIREDPGGIGVYALSRQGCSIASRCRGPEGKSLPGWWVQLTPDTFLGRDEAPVLPDDQAPRPHGTAVSFVSDHTPQRIEHALRAAALHCPVAVSFNGECVPREAFLDGAVHAERWRGLVFGVFSGVHAPRQEPDLNFHGLTLTVSLPAVNTIDNGPYSVRADVDSCPGLELVLPARKEAVETPFLAEMRSAATLAIYRAIAAAAPPAPVSFDDHTAAAAAGIHIPQPPPRLRRSHPDIASTDDWRNHPPSASTGPDTLVIETDSEPPDQQVLFRAAERSGIAYRLFEPDRRLAGYPWYDALTRVRAAQTRIVHDGAAMTLDTIRALDDKRPPGARRRATSFPSRPDAIDVILQLANPGSQPASIAMSSDVAFAGDAGCYTDDIAPMVTGDSPLQPFQLAAIMRAAFFSASDDCDADSWETQRDRFDEDAIHQAIRLLASEDEARKHTIAEAIHRQIFWALPNDRRVSIVVERGRVTVDFAQREAAA